MIETPIVTGLSGLNVNRTEDRAPEPGDLEVAAALPNDFTISDIGALVRDIAVDMQGLPEILKKHKLTSEQYQVLRRNTHFQNTLTAAVTEWNRPGSTLDRLALMAAMALEKAMPTIAARMSVKTEPLADVIAAAKLFASLAGIDAKNAPKQASEKFTISINLGADKQVYEKSRPLIEVGTPNAGT
jgi:hypothetical protein